MYPSQDMIIHREKLLKEILEKKRRVKEVAEILDVKRETVSRWLAKYRFEGLDGYGYARKSLDQNKEVLP